MRIIKYIEATLNNLNNWFTPWQFRCNLSYIYLFRLLHSNSNTHIHIGVIKPERAEQN